jgi:hypothetical protein
MAEIIEFSKNGKPLVGEAAPSSCTKPSLVTEIRALHLKIQGAEGSALLLAMDAGDLLAKRKAVTAHGHWALFLRDCGLKARTDQVYRQLAAARVVIEAANAQSSAPLSIAEALKLIGPKTPKSKQSQSEGRLPVAAMAPATITVDDVIAWLAQASVEDKRRIAVALAQDTATIRKLLPAKAMPAKATPEEIFKKAMGILTPDADPTVH